MPMDWAYQMNREAQANGYPNWQSYQHAMRMQARADADKAQRQRRAEVTKLQMRSATPSAACRVLPHDSASR